MAYGANVLSPTVSASYDLNPNRVSRFLSELSPTDLQVLQGLALAAAHDIIKVRKLGDTGLLLDYGAQCGLSEDAILRLCDLDDKYDLWTTLGSIGTAVGNVIQKGAGFVGNLVGSVLSPVVQSVVGPILGSTSPSPVMTASGAPVPAQTQVNVPVTGQTSSQGSFNSVPPLTGTSVSFNPPQSASSPYVNVPPITGTSASIRPSTGPSAGSTISNTIETVAQYVIPAFIPGVGYQTAFTPAAPITGSQVSPTAQMPQPAPQQAPLQNPVFVPSSPTTVAWVPAGPIIGSYASFTPPLTTTVLTGAPAYSQPAPVYSTQPVQAAPTSPTTLPPTPVSAAREATGIPTSWQQPTSTTVTGTLVTGTSLANWNEILTVYKNTTKKVSGWPPAETVLLAIIEHFAQGQGYTTAGKIGYQLDGRVETRMCTHCDVNSPLSTPMSGIFYSTPWFSAELTDLPSGVYGMINTEKKPFRIRLNRNVPFPRMMVSAAHETLHAMADLYKLNVSHDQIHGLAFFLVDNVIPLLNSLSDLQNKEQLRKQ